MDCQYGVTEFSKEKSLAIQKAVEIGVESLNQSNSNLISKEEKSKLATNIFDLTVDYINIGKSIGEAITEAFNSYRTDGYTECDCKSASGEAICFLKKS